MVNEENPSKAQLWWEKILPMFFCVKIISHESTNGECSSLICDTLPETNIAPEDRLPEKKLVFQPSISRCEVLASGRVWQRKFRPI